MCGCALCYLIHNNASDLCLFYLLFSVMTFLYLNYYQLSLFYWNDSARSKALHNERLLLFTFRIERDKCQNTISFIRTFTIDYRIYYHINRTLKRNLILGGNFRLVFIRMALYFDGVIDLKIENKRLPACSCMNHAFLRPESVLSWFTSATDTHTNTHAHIRMYAGVRKRQ